MYKIKPTKKFRKDFKHIASDIKLVDEISAVVNLLSADDNPLPEIYRDHQLKGKYKVYRECHVRPDWLLVYQKNKKEMILLLVRTNTHSEIFE
ncbi:MAG: type II toxin-antitoxin system YafQ family toxin [Tannerella sp.]|jgi:mRNA interferase YafQ|nr:type II toxin-antitoxin system YafQ family toxin [Tannerella sp.]